MREQDGICLLLFWLEKAKDEGWLVVGENGSAGESGREKGERACECVTTDAARDGMTL